MDECITAKQEIVFNIIPVISEKVKSISGNPKKGQELKFKTEKSLLQGNLSNW